jgi:hypothetical protein
VSVAGPKEAFLSLQFVFGVMDVIKSFLGLGYRMKNVSLLFVA